MPGETIFGAERLGPGLEAATSRAAAALAARQKPDGHWVFPLEADATIPAEYMLLEHFLDRIDPALEPRIGVHLRAIQGDHGGWPLYHGGGFNLSASVKAYFALRCLGDPPHASHMRAAREAILAAGGAERANVFTRFQLALFGAVPWRAVPVMPVELVLLPRWFPFHLDKVSYWSRTVIVPLTVLAALRPRARNPRGVTIDELFRTPPALVTDWIRPPDASRWGRFFAALDAVLRRAEPFAPKPLRRRAVARALAWVRERSNGEDGLGAIYPAMANSVMMFDALGYPPEHPEAAIAWAAVRRLLIEEGPGRAWCQPCVSPVWDTALAGHAMAEAEGAASGVVEEACNWLIPRQILDVKGDWASRRPATPPGGWAFQYANPHYPDVDDTAVAAMLLHRNGAPAHTEAIERARLWILGMQSRGGGWGAFDADNTHFHLNHIPFADHGALLDPPTADVTARCVSFLAQLGDRRDRPAIERALAWLRAEQEPEGCWFGRWGTNYIYGTWSVLAAFNAAGVARDAPEVTRAVAWLLSRQRADGGWGEDCRSYEGGPKGEFHESTPSHTAWAVLGLMAAGEGSGAAVARGIGWLVGAQNEDGSWAEEAYNAVGFPRVFYLRYHGYPQFFPLLALARYRAQRRANSTDVRFGL